uniref:Upstream transcription factor 2, c-fos interacting n=1 Tax=Panthera tigris altaica TaxID=74533 RepID=A0A8C9JUM3_PANTA
PPPPPPPAGGDGPGAEEQTAVAIASVQQAAFGDHNIQYQFRTENNGGQVTYRVVQVTDGQLDGQGDTAGAVSVVSTAAFAGGQQAVTQVGVDGAAQRPGPTAASVPPGPAAPFPLAVIQNPFSNGGSPAAEAVSGEARFAYFPASSVGDTTAVSVQTTDQSLQAGGQFYVMMTPQDVLQTGTQRTIAPRTHPYSPKIDGTRTPRDERRRAQHNEGKAGVEFLGLTGTARPGAWCHRSATSELGLGCGVSEGPPLGSQAVVALLLTGCVTRGCFSASVPVRCCVEWWPRGSPGHSW